MSDGILPQVLPGILPVPDPVLDDLQARLQNIRWPAVVEGQGWTRGIDLDYLRQLVDYWRTGFDWRAQESALSRFNHEQLQVAGLSLHQIHERAVDPNALPIVLLHGWPDSFLRYTKVLPLWTVSTESCLLFLASASRSGQPRLAGTRFGWRTLLPS